MASSFIFVHFILEREGGTEGGIEEQQQRTPTPYRKKKQPPVSQWRRRHADRQTDSSIPLTVNAVEGTNAYLTDETTIVPSPPLPSPWI
mmetsp:Transcript_36620/g.117439  ORF Transcript_36620/g.117439 Transcript_36620/m.117439 type:complete len:89 (+) Transcript_36620:810-1076(+)